jgi:hypothetical protein
MNRTDCCWVDTESNNVEKGGRCVELEGEKMCRKSTSPSNLKKTVCGYLGFAKHLLQNVFQDQRYTLSAGCDKGVVGEGRSSQPPVV